MVGLFVITRTFSLPLGRVGVKVRWNTHEIIPSMGTGLLQRAFPFDLGLGYTLRAIFLPESSQRPGGRGHLEGLAQRTRCRGGFGERRSEGRRKRLGDVLVVRVVVLFDYLEVSLIHEAMESSLLH